MEQTEGQTDRWVQFVLRPQRQICMLDINNNDHVTTITNKQDDTLSLGHSA